MPTALRHRRRRQRVKPHQVARWLTFAVVALQIALLAVFALYPDDPPASGTLWQALWARANMPTFYPLIALLFAGLPASYLALAARGPHRRWLLITWIVFLSLTLTFYGHRVAVMLNILWKYG